MCYRKGMNRLRKVIWVAGGILMAALLVFTIWLPGVVKDYLNRPDTNIRKKMDAALTEKFGEPASLAFHISSARPSLPLNLHLELADVEISSATLKTLGARLQKMDVDVSLGGLLLQKKLLIRRMAVLIPHLTYAPLPDGRWPHEKLMQHQKSEPASGAIAAARPDKGMSIVLDEFDLIVNDAKLSPKPGVTAGMKDLHVNYRGVEGTLGMEAKQLNLSGVPTFSELATTLNAITDALSALLDGSLSIAGKIANKLAGLLDKGRRNKSNEAADAAHQTTEFDEARIRVKFLDGTAKVEEAVFSNSEMTIRATGTVGLDDGKLNLTTQIAFQEEGLKKFSSSLTRKILSDGVSIPLRGTAMDPKFDKHVFLKEVMKHVGKSF